MSKYISKKKILIHDFSGHPFQFELSVELAKSTFKVTHAYSIDEGGPKANFTLKKNLFIFPISIGYKLPKNSILKRFFWELKYAFNLIRFVNKNKPDLIIQSNTPPLVLIIFNMFCRIPWIWWVQDIFSEAAANMDILPKFARKIAQNLFFGLESILSKLASHVILISKDFSNFFSNLDNTKISIIENWSPDYKSKKYKKRIGIVYAGTVGKKHYSRDLIDVIQYFLDHGETFNLISEGTYADKIYTKFYKNKNFKKFNFLNTKDLDAILDKSKAAMFVLEKKASKVSIPSKVYTYIKHDLPVFGLIDSNHHTAKLILSNDFGVVNERENFISKINNINWIKDFQHRAFLFNRKYNSVQHKAEAFKIIIANFFNNKH